jgi:tight adherence protein C
MNALIIALLTGVAVLALGGAFLLLARARREAQLARQRTLLEKDKAVETELTDGTGRPKLIHSVHKVGQAMSGPGISRSLKQDLASAGYHNPSAATIYLGSKLLLFLGGAVLAGALLSLMKLTVPVMLVVVGLFAMVMFFVPNLVVGIRRDRRRAEIRQHLPDVVDMLEICVSAGMGLDMAWNAVADEIRRVSTTLADEMELANLEISLGVSRAIAMRNMAERTGVQDISSLVALLVQSERFGASIVEALRTFAKSMRDIRSQRAEEAAEKMSVKLLFPMVVFIFPVMFIVMVGPAVLTLFENLTRG